MTRLYAIGALVALIAVVGGAGLAVWFGRQGEDAFAQCRGGAVSGAGNIGGPFELTSETGETVTSDALLTEPALLYFGYTFCPDVCPFDSARNADAVDILAGRGQSVLPVFISVDPRRDTPQALRDFTDAFHDEMIGLTGTREQIDQAVQAYRVYYDIRDEEDDEYYLVDHSAFTYLVLPEVGFVDYFSREDTPEEMADRIGCFIDAAS